MVGVVALLVMVTMVLIVIVGMVMVAVVRLVVTVAVVVWCSGCDNGGVRRSPRGVGGAS